MSETIWRDVVVAWATPSALAGFGETDLAAMGQGQVDRLRQLSGDGARAFLAGRALISDLARRVIGQREVVLDSRCDRCGRHHGRPRTAGASLSVSHAEDLVVVAMAPGLMPLGVDVEALTSTDRVVEVASLFPGGVAPDLAGWTRIEAAVKADGRGFEIDPAAVMLHPESQASDVHVWSATVPGRAAPLEVVTLEGPSGHVLSVAVG